MDASATPGTVTLQDGELIYVADDPAQDAFLGDWGDTVSFLYTVRTAGGGELHTGEVRVQVMGVNDAPVATADAVAVEEGASTGNLWEALKANDWDPDYGQRYDIDSVDVTGSLGRVSFDAESQTLVYHADTDAIRALAPGQTRVDQFSYTVRDWDGATSSAVVTVTVGGADGLGGAGWALL